MPRGQKARKQNYVKYDVVVCPIRATNSTEIFCLKERCALYVQKVERCSIWLISYNLQKILVRMDGEVRKEGEEG